jgi:hypothetical protein
MHCKLQETDNHISVDQPTAGVTPGPLVTTEKGFQSSDTLPKKQNQKDDFPFSGPLQRQNVKSSPQEHVGYSFRKQFTSAKS